MSSRSIRRDTMRIAGEAAGWMDALHSADASTRSAFVDWLDASPRHVEEFLLLTATEQAWQDVDTGRRIDVDALIAAGHTSVVQMSATASTGAGRMRRPRRRTLTYLTAATAAAVAVAAAVLWSPWPGDDGRARYATAIGEQRAVELGDGSLVHLNTHTRIEVHLDAQRREVRLLEGEALFKVMHDAARPFQVRSGAAVIQVVGTQFNVSRAARGTTVAVIEGRVKVSGSTMPAGERIADTAGPGPALLSAGERADIVDDGRITRAAVDTAEIALWRQRRLVFRDSTLGEIAAEFNRYNRVPQIVVEGEAARERRYGGTFDADDPQALIRFLRPEAGLICESRDSKLIIRPDLIHQDPAHPTPRPAQ
jgi:transmembrane sensor